MNEAHERLCSSAGWAEYLSGDVLPRVLASVSLGDHLLEVGPGFGMATDALRTKVSQITVVEANEEYATSLAKRLEGANVAVEVGDATALPYEDASFTSAASFTMLHHVPSSDLQNDLLAEVARVLGPGGVFVGSDSLDSPGFRGFHEGDVCNPLAPEDLANRLAAVGFDDVTVTGEWTSQEREDEVHGTMFFVAHVPVGRERRRQPRRTV